MATGYSQIFSRYQSSFLEDWIFFLKSNFILDINKIAVVDNEGNSVLATLSKAIEIFTAHRSLTIKVRNTHNSSVFISLKVVDNYLATESYDFDELLINEEYLEMYSKLNNRFQDFMRKKSGIKNKKKEEGYSEDY